MLRARVRAGVVAVALMLCASVGVSAQNYTPSLSFSVSGDMVTLQWSAIPGATGYDVLVKAAGISLPAIPVGNRTNISYPAPPGVYQVSVRGTLGAITGRFSNEVTIPVNAAPPSPPPPPTGFAAFVNGTNALLSWVLPPGQALTGLLIDVVSGPYAGTQLPVRVSTSSYVEGLPLGNHVLQLRAISANGVSGPSNPLELNVPATTCSGASLPVQASSAYGYSTANWPGLPGALGYHVDVFMNGQHVLSQPLPPNSTHVSSPTPDGHYTIQVRAAFACGIVSGSANFTSSNAPGAGPRTPDPAPGTRLPIPSYAEGVIRAVANQFPGDLHNSCGNNTFLYRAVQALRQYDSRWGLNWKRGNRGDMSQDVVNYHFGPGPDEDSIDVYIFDIIGGHCGPGPYPRFADVTEATRVGGTIGRWTIRPMIEAGFQP